MYHAQRLRDFDSGDACKSANEDAGASNGWGRETVHLTNVQRSQNLSAIHIERVERPVGKTVYRMTANYWRADDVPGRLPALAQLPVCVYRNLEYSIRAGNKDDRANRSRATKGLTHILRIDLTADAAKRIGVQGISLAGLARREDEIAGKQYRPLRSHIRVICIFLSPGRRRESI